MDRLLSLFGDEPAVASTRTRPAAPVAKTQTRHDAQRQDAQRRYADWRGDVETLATAWEELHVWFLQRHLKLLASVHTERAEREDILAWLEAPITTGPTGGAQRPGLPGDLRWPHRPAGVSAGGAATEPTRGGTTPRGGLILC